MYEERKLLPHFTIQSIQSRFISFLCFLLLLSSNRRGREEKKKRCIVPLLPISVHYKFNMKDKEKPREREREREKKRKTRHRLLDDCFSFT